MEWKLWKEYAGYSTLVGKPSITDYHVPSTLDDIQNYGFTVYRNEILVLLKKEMKIRQKKHFYKCINQATKQK